jgi:hypothetical protein
MLGIFFERRKNEKGSVRFWHTWSLKAHVWEGLMNG